jgi:hypothetical protein
MSEEGADSSLEFPVSYKRAEENKFPAADENSACR